MVKASPIAAVALAFAGLSPAHAEAVATSRAVELALPRAVSANEAIDLEVQTGVLPRGTEIEVTTPSGERIGTISPFAVRSGHAAGTYTLPLKASDIHDGRVTVRLTVIQYGMPERAPTADEVPNVGVSITRTAP